MSMWKLMEITFTTLKAVVQIVTETPTQGGAQDVMSAQAVLMTGTTIMMKSADGAATQTTHG